MTLSLLLLAERFWGDDSLGLEGLSPWRSRSQGPQPEGLMPQLCMAVCSRLANSVGCWRCRRGDRRRAGLDCFSGAGGDTVSGVGSTLRGGAVSLESVGSAAVGAVALENIVASSFNLSYALGGSVAASWPLVGLDRASVRSVRVAMIKSSPVATGIV